MNYLIKLLKNNNNNVITEKISEHITLKEQLKHPTKKV